MGARSRYRPPRTLPMFSTNRVVDKFSFPVPGPSPARRDGSPHPCGFCQERGYRADAPFSWHLHPYAAATGDDDGVERRPNPAYRRPVGVRIAMVAVVAVAIGGLVWVA